MSQLRPPNRVSGTGKDAAWLNQLRDCVAALWPQRSSGTITKHTTQGVIRTSTPGKSTPAAPAESGTWV